MTDQNLNQPQKEGESVEQKKKVLLDSLLTKYIEGGYGRDGCDGCGCCCAQ